MADNLVLSESDFEEFRQYCRQRGFDLCYFSSEISGSRQEIANLQFGSPKVIKIIKRRFSLRGVPYDVAEYQQNEWKRAFPSIKEEFFRRVGNDK